MSDHSPLPLPRVLVLCVAIVGGVMTAVVAQLALMRLGLDLGALWRNLMGARSGQMRAAFAWWAIALVSFVAGLAIAAAMRGLAAAGIRSPALYGIAGAALVAGLAVAGRMAAAPSDLGPGASAMLGLASLTVAGLLALLGAYFATRR
ncbi:MAG: hypothetical protein HZA68_10270 [Rhodovulum sp.]|nr:hypothetical protein [Rhodovulum sp.]